MFVESDPAQIEDLLPFLSLTCGHADPPLGVLPGQSPHGGVLGREEGRHDLAPDGAVQQPVDHRVRREAGWGKSYVLVHNTIYSTDPLMMREPFKWTMLYLPRHQKHEGNAAQLFRRRPRLGNPDLNEPHHPGEKCH